MKPFLILIVCCFVGIYLIANIGSFMTPDENTANITDSASNNTNVESVKNNGNATANDTTQSSTPRLGSKKNPKTTLDHVDGDIYDPNPNYGDYYYLNGTLFRDDNQYLGGAGTLSVISGKNPYETSSSSSSGSSSSSSSSSTSSSSFRYTNHDNEYHKYVSSKNSNRFHETYCSQASRIKNSNKRYYYSRREALNAGKTPCKVCDP